MVRIIKDLFVFFRKPKKNSVIYRKPIERFHVFSLGFLLIVLGIFLTTILQFIVINYIDSDFTNFNRNKYLINQRNFLKIVIFVPLIEELGFRLFLRPKKLFFINLSLSIISFYIIGFIFTDLQINYRIGISFIIFIISSVYAKNSMKIIKNNYAKVFYLSSFIFALLHLKAYHSLTLTQYILFPLIILPYFIYGLSFSYVRVKTNILLAILLHIVINGIAFSIKYLITLF